MKSHVAILVGLTAGLVLGLVGWATGSGFLAATVRALEPVGQVFANLLRMAVIPIVVTALFAGVARLGDVRRLGRLGAKTLGFFWGTTLVAIAIGFGSARLILPLAPLGEAQRAEFTPARPDTSLVEAAAEARKTGAEFLVELIPNNPVAAAVRGDLLPLIIFTLIAALATAALPSEKRIILVELAESATSALIRIVHWALALAPLGVGALIAPIALRLGWSMVGAIGAFFLATIAGLAVLVAAVYAPLLWLGASANPGKVIRAATAAIAMGFSTTTSLAALPLLMEAAERRLNLPSAVSGLGIPLGVSLNRSGSALYQGVALLFLAELFTIDIPVVGLIAALIAVFLASLTVAAVPSASVLSLAPALTATGVPLSGLGVLLGVDRIPDMFRTAVNVTGTISGTVYVGQGEIRRDSGSG